MTPHRASRRPPLWAALVALGLALVLAGGAAAAWDAHPVAQEPPAAEPAAGCGEWPYLEVDIETRPRLWLEIAATPADRARGLMFREWMDWNSGMLFIFEGQSQAGFWMRNTLLPLSIAWVDLDGTIVDIQDMYPLSDDIHTPVAPYWLAVEVNQGWFQANGVGVGHRMQFCLA